MPQWVVAALAKLRESAGKFFDSSDPTIDFSHVVLLVAFVFATFWLTKALHAKGWEITATWGAAFATYMSAIFAKGIWGKDGK